MPDPIPHESRPVRWWQRSDSLIGFSAIILSMCAVSVSIYQAHLMRVQQRMSVWPNVEVLLERGVSGYRLTAVNTGVGPARIGPVRVVVNEELVHSWAELWDRLGLGEEFTFNFGTIGGRVIPANGSVVIVNVPPEHAASIARTIQTFRVSMCYCSVFDECWLTGMNRLETDTDVCALPESERFKN
ncbi:MAG: hypothetical protein R2834_22280 [Rhodothermales bacterium]